MSDKKAMLRVTVEDMETGEKATRDARHHSQGAHTVSSDRISEIRARLEAITQPWTLEWDGQTLYVNDAEGGEIVAQTFAISTWEPEYSEQKAECDTAPAELIAHAPADIAHLLAEVERLTAERDFFERNAHRATAMLVAEYDLRTAAEQWAATLVEVFAPLMCYLEAAAESARHHGTSEDNGHATEDRLAAVNDVLLRRSDIDLARAALAAHSAAPGEG